VASKVRKWFLGEEGEKLAREYVESIEAACVPEKCNVLSGPNQAKDGRWYVDLEVNRGPEEGTK
jgi:hypothetical protein